MKIRPQKQFFCCCCCFVSSSFIYLIRPTPIIYWIKEDGTLPTNRTFYRNFQKTLQITQVSEADSGKYQCIAKNALGVIHHTISVTVKGTYHCLKCIALTCMRGPTSSIHMPPIIFFNNNKRKFRSTSMIV